MMVIIKEIRSEYENDTRLYEKQGYDAIVIPTADPHQSEYPAPAYRLRAHLSGFTGSAAHWL